MTPDVASLPDLPTNDAGPVFAEPWQAQAFALALVLHEAGVFTWKEWSEALGREIARAREAGDADLGDTYYLHWLNALEGLCLEKTGMRAGEIAARKERWRRAYLLTPHGQPVELSTADSKT